MNGRCEATVEHCRRSGGGLWFSDVVGFEVIIDRLSSDSALRDRLAARGGAYARRQFSWPAIVDRYDALADRILTTHAVVGHESARRSPL